MAYLDVISLATAKTHLRIDDNASDTEITRMIKSALGYIERYTNVLVYARDKQYYTDPSGCLRVYDFPINTVTPTTLKSQRYATYTTYEGKKNEAITLNVGYTSPDDVPSDIIESALAIIDVWYYNAEKETSASIIPMSVKCDLDLHKRFIV